LGKVPSAPVGPTVKKEGVGALVLYCCTTIFGVEDGCFRKKING
jgi:hypothetical protein